MSTRLSTLVVLLLLFLSPSAFSDAHEDGIPPRIWSWPYTPISNVTEPEVVELAEYAVTEYNQRSGAKLKLVKILKAETQVVNPLTAANYRLTLKAKDACECDDHFNNYQAIVYEEGVIGGPDFQNLTFFKPLPHHPH